MTLNNPGAAELPITSLTPADTAELLVLQRCCWVQEALVNQTLDIPPLHESLDDVEASFGSWSVWGVRMAHRLVGAVRARHINEEWEIGRLMVAPDLAGRGLGRRLLAYAESHAPQGIPRYVLFTGARSVRNLTMYQRAGYHLTDNPESAPGHITGAVHLSKPNPATQPA